MSAPNDYVRFNFPPGRKIVEREVSMHRIEMVVLVGLYALLLPVILLLTVHTERVPTG
jgi:hypothetical protein